MARVACRKTFKTVRSRVSEKNGKRCFYLHCAGRRSWTHLKPSQAAPGPGTDPGHPRNPAALPPLGGGEPGPGLTPTTLQRALFDGGRPFFFWCWWVLAKAARRMRIYDSVHSFIHSGRPRNAQHPLRLIVQSGWMLRQRLHGLGSRQVVAAVHRGTPGSG